MTYDTSSRKDIRRAEKDSRLAASAEAEVIKALCSHANGREWLWARLEDAHVFTTTYSPDALAMAFAEGERNAGLRLLAQITAHCPEQFTSMMREANDRRNRNRDTDRDADDAEPDFFDSAGAYGPHHDAAN